MCIIKFNAAEASWSVYYLESSRMFGIVHLSKLQKYKNINLFLVNIVLVILLTFNIFT